MRYDEAFRKHMFRQEDVYDYSPAVNNILHANYLTDASTSLAYIREMQACRDNSGDGGGGGIAAWRLKVCRKWIHFLWQVTVLSFVNVEDLQVFVDGGR